jgi:RNA polymerase sigma-70 factor (ECF subfamily)
MLALVTGRGMTDEGDSKRPQLRVVAGGSTRSAREEEALLAAFLVGDDEAFGALVRRHERLVLSLVRRYARDPEDARDLAQRTFLRAFEAARRSLRRGSTLGGGNAVPFRRWLIRIAVNLGKNHLRDRTRFRVVGLDDVTEDRLPSTPAPATDELERAERAARVKAAVLELPKRQREVLTLRVDGELAFGDIAETLKITENAARVSFHYALQKLRALLGPEAEEKP